MKPSESIFMSLVLTGNGHHVISEIHAAIDKQIRRDFYSHFVKIDDICDPDYQGKYIDITNPCCHW